MEASHKLAWASVLLAALGIGLMLIIEYADPAWIPEVWHPILAYGGFTLAAVGLLGLLTLLVPYLFKRRSPRKTIEPPSPSPATVFKQIRGDGGRDQNEAGRDVRIDNRVIYERQTEGEPFIEVGAAGWVEEVGGMVFVMFPELRVVNPQPHRRLSARLQGRLCGEFGETVASYPHSPDLYAEATPARMLPPVINLGPRSEREGGAALLLDELRVLPRLWLVLTDTVTGNEICRVDGLLGEPHRPAPTPPAAPPPTKSGS